MRRLFLLDPDVVFLNHGLRGLPPARVIEVPAWDWNGTPLMRVSVQGYTAANVEALVEALPRVL